MNSRSRGTLHLTIAALCIVLAMVLLGPSPAYAQSESLLFSFNTGSGNGVLPYGGLIMDPSGNLYGTTNGGGAHSKGIVFEITPGGTFSVLWSFGGTGDGANPEGDLIIDSSGNLYGTTTNGGAHGDGTVFELSPGSSWSETILYSFGAVTHDGNTPYGRLMFDSSGNIYGTCNSGGTGAYGTVFKLSLSGSTWSETTLHNFGGGSSDGASPYGGLVMDVGGNLYGTTQGGGSNNDGVVFTIASGTFAVIHSFTNSPDGRFPYGGLVIDSSGNLYGTTTTGGTAGNGMVFELVLSGGSWTESVYYSFASSQDGANPYGTLIMDGEGNLWGTTAAGGKTIGGVGHNSGTVFEISGATTEAYLYTLLGGTGDGSDPYADLVMDSTGNLYGSTYGSGANTEGTVFRIVQDSSITSSAYAGLLGNCGCNVTLANGISSLLNGLFSPSAGDPIDIASGNVFYQTTDYTTAGQNPLAFTRYYNSRGNASNISTFAKTLGVNWRSTFDRYIQIKSLSQVVVERPDGRQVVFTSDGYTWTPATDVDITLTKSGTTWTLTDHDDTVETYTTTTSGNEALLGTIASRNGYTLALSYNGSNQLTSVSDSYSRSLSLTYNTNGTLDTVTTPDSTTLTFGYNSVTGGYQLTSLTYSTSPTTSQTYAYTASGLPFALTSITDENSNTYETWTYDSHGRGLTNVRGSSADTVTLTYNDTTGARTVTNALSVTDTYTYTMLQGIPKVTQISRASTSTTAAATESFSYDSNGYLSSFTDWNGNQTTYTNNSHGMPTTINEAVGASVARTTTIAYDSTFVHLPDSITTPGVTTSFTYDGSGNVLTRKLTDTTTSSTPYSTNGQTRTWTYTWSSYLLASAKSPNSNTTTFGYSSSGALTSITDALSHVTSITSYTGGGLPLTVVDPNSVTTTLTYSPRQWLLTSSVSTTGGARTTTFSYDAAGNLAQITWPDSSSLAATYDTAHRVTQITDALGNYVALTLDALGDKTQALWKNSSSVTKRQHTATFDALGRILTDVGGVSGETTTLTYDKDGNRLTVTDPDSNVTTNTFDALNRFATVTDANSGVTTPAFDAHNRLTSLTDPNSNATTFVIDGFGDVIQQTSPDTGTTVYHYDSDGNLTQKVDAASVTTNLTYDALDRISTVAYPADSTLNVAATYDQTGTGYGKGVGR